MYVNAVKSAAQIAVIADVAATDASLIPALIDSLNQYPHATRVAIAALAMALASAVTQS
jgi:hypothetical protein